MQGSNCDVSETGKANAGFGPEGSHRFTRPRTLTIAYAAELISHIRPRILQVNDTILLCNGIDFIHENVLSQVA
jgi:hypothetical protein